MWVVLAKDSQNNGSSLDFRKLAAAKRVKPFPCKTPRASLHVLLRASYKLLRKTSFLAWRFDSG